VQDLYKKLLPITTHEVFVYGEWAIQAVYGAGMSFARQIQKY